MILLSRNYYWDMANRLSRRRRLLRSVNIAKSLKILWAHILLASKLNQSSPNKHTPVINIVPMSMDRSCDHKNANNAPNRKNPEEEKEKIMSHNVDKSCFYLIKLDCKIIRYLLPIQYTFFRVHISIPLCLNSTSGLLTKYESTSGRV